MLVCGNICCSNTYTFLQKTTTCVERKDDDTQGVESDPPSPPSPSPSNAAIDAPSMSAMTRQTFCISDDAQALGPSQPSRGQWECRTHHVVVPMEEYPQSDMSPAQPHVERLDELPRIPGPLGSA
jgi:hypothetical protein